MDHQLISQLKRAERRGSLRRKPSTETGSTSGYHSAAESKQSHHRKRSSLAKLQAAKALNHHTIAFYPGIAYEEPTCLNSTAEISDLGCDDELYGSNSDEDSAKSKLRALQPPRKSYFESNENSIEDNSTEVDSSELINQLEKLAMEECSSREGSRNVSAVVAGGERLPQQNMSRQPSEGIPTAVASTAAQFNPVPAPVFIPPHSAALKTAFDHAEFYCSASGSTTPSKTNTQSSTPLRNTAVITAAPVTAGASSAEELRNQMLWDKLNQVQQQLQLLLESQQKASAATPSSRHLGLVKANVSRPQSPSNHISNPTIHEILKKSPLDRRSSLPLRSNLPTHARSKTITAGADTPHRSPTSRSTNISPNNTAPLSAELRISPSSTQNIEFVIGKVDSQHVRRRNASIHSLPSSPRNRSRRVSIDGDNFPAIDTVKVSSRAIVSDFRHSPAVSGCNSKAVTPPPEPAESEILPIMSPTISSDGSSTIQKPVLRRSASTRLPQRRLTMPAGSVMKALQAAAAQVKAEEEHLGAKNNNNENNNSLSISNGAGNTTASKIQVQAAASSGNIPALKLHPVAAAGSYQGDDNYPRSARSHRPRSNTTDSGSSSSPSAHQPIFLKNSAGKSLSRDFDNSSVEFKVNVTNAQSTISTNTSNSPSTSIKNSGSTASLNTLNMSPAVSPYPHSHSPSPQGSPATNSHFSNPTPDAKTGLSALSALNSLSPQIGRRLSGKFSNPVSPMLGYSPPKKIDENAPLHTAESRELIVPLQLTSSCSTASSPESSTNVSPVKSVAQRSLQVSNPLNSPRQGRSLVNNPFFPQNNSAVQQQQQTPSPTTLNRLSSRTNSSESIIFSGQHSSSSGAVSAPTTNVHSTPEKLNILAVNSVLSSFDALNAADTRRIKQPLASPAMNALPRSYCVSPAATTASSISTMSTLEGLTSPGSLTSSTSSTSQPGLTNSPNSSRQISASSVSSIDDHKHDTPDNLISNKAIEQQQLPSHAKYNDTIRNRLVKAAMPNARTNSITNSNS
jgi:hypothetical protein